jgi:hypothetical protein
MARLAKLTTIIFLALTACLSSCSKKTDECVYTPETGDIKIDLQFEQLEDSLANVTSRQAMVDLLTRQPLIRDYMFRRTEYPHDSAFINSLYHKFTNPHFDTLLQETRRAFGDLSTLKAEFTQAFTNIKYYYPDFTPPRVQTIISGLDTDLFVSDSLIIVSLDFFLGEGARYRPKLYDYLLRQYNPENIVPSCLLIYGIGPRINNTDLNDKTVIADMVAYGKSYYFAKHMLPCVPDSTFIWYTPEEIEGSRKNQDLIWARFIQDEVLYATSHLTKQKYLGDRPKTLEVGEKCPGRIAIWVGWQIVNAYAENHPDATLPEVMKVANAQQFFKASGYKPQK